MKGTGRIGEDAEIVLAPPAKVNLFLRILAREEGGYHQLETLFQWVDLRDRLRIERTAESGFSLEVTGPEAAELGDPDQNLVLRAARGWLAALSQAGQAPEGGFRLMLEKHIPHGGGLGGGSSDAASTLAGLNRLLGDPLPAEHLLRIAAGIGSDIPAFLSPSPTTLAWGRGGRLLPLVPLPVAPVILALPPLRVSTPAAFGELARVRAAAPAPPPPILLDSERLTRWEGVAGMAANDFEPPVFGMHPELAAHRSALVETGARIALLSGSGAALFGVFPDPDRARSALPELRTAFPATRFVLTTTLATANGPHAVGA